MGLVRKGTFGVEKVETAGKIVCTFLGYLGNPKGGGLFISPERGD